MCHQASNTKRRWAVTWMMWAELQINGDSPVQLERTGLLCKLRGNDTAIRSAREQIPPVTQHSLELAGGLCVFGKHTLPEIELESVSKRNSLSWPLKHSAGGVCLGA